MENAEILKILELEFWWVGDEHQNNFVKKEMKNNTEKQAESERENKSQAQQGYGDLAVSATLMYVNG